MASDSDSIKTELDNNKFDKESYSNKVSLAAAGIAFIYEYNYLSKSNSKTKMSVNKQLLFCFGSSAFCFFITKFIISKTGFFYLGDDNQNNSEKGVSNNKITNMKV